jgi:S1-C subfamily serine protease
MSFLNHVEMITPHMKKTLIPLLGILFHGVAAAQDDIPLLRPEEKAAIKAQADEYREAFSPSLTEAAESTVRVWSGKRRLAYGTVVGDGRSILTKWSELARGQGDLRVEGAGGRVLAAKVTGVYQDEDLAVLEINGTPLKPVKWSEAPAKLGSFLAAPQPDGRPAAFGVVSVLERNLRETDQAYLGVQGDPDFDGPGVRIDEVAEESGAEKAGLKSGDVILKVGDRSISGLLELKNSLVDTTPGSTVTLTILDRDEKEKKVEVLLGNRPKLGGFSGDRLRMMERMGTTPSRVRDSFSRVIQTDMRLEASLIGGPVVNLKGEVIGISVARGDRTRSFIMPSSMIETLLKEKPTDPSLAKLQAEEETPAVNMRGGEGRMPRMKQGSEERLRQHLGEMQRLMDFMREEMEDLERQGR